MSEKKVQGWYSIDIEKALNLYGMKVDEFRDRVQQDLDQQVPLRLSVFDYLANNSAAFGPFAKKDHAIAMAATELDEDDKDIFGNSWDFVTFKVSENLIVAPNFKNLMKRYICLDPDCRAVQTFQGCCQVCRFDPEKKNNYTKTTIYRKWDSE
tara:strand:- start:1094 stop:1552 length:459 start_codon:yes stop_codon:yes gene_type:complete